MTELNQEELTMKVTLINNNNGDIKEVKLGFSWTTFFWGGLVPLIRKDWIAAMILIAVNIISLFARMDLGIFSLTLQ